MRVVITGTSHGIGLATAAKFMGAGHEVIGIDWDSAPEILMHFSGSCAGHIGTYTHVMANVSCVSTLPDIPNCDVLINNAGVQIEGLNIPVNLMGVINCCEKYALQPSIKAVVNVASVSAHNGAEFPLYTASKGGVLAYTKWLAQEVAKYGATANSISPGGVITPMTADIWNDEVKRQMVLDETLLNRWASSHEIAEWIYFICVVNKSMTAQDIIIDNGETANYNFIQ